MAKDDQDREDQPGDLVRLVAYVYEDEEAELAKRAKRERTSKSEIVRRALRDYLGMVD